MTDHAAGRALILAFADPENQIGFAYVMNQMEIGVLPKSRAIALVHALYDFP